MTVTALAPRLIRSRFVLVAGVAMGPIRDAAEAPNTDRSVGAGPASAPPAPRRGLPQIIVALLAEDSHPFGVVCPSVRFA
jgi:hypothetical protein